MIFLLYNSCFRLAWKQGRWAVNEGTTLGISHALFWPKRSKEKSRSLSAAMFLAAMLVPTGGREQSVNSGY